MKTTLKNTFFLIPILLLAACYADDEGPDSINRPTIVEVSYGNSSGRSIYIRWEDSLRNLPSYSLYRSEDNVNFSLLTDVHEKAYGDTNNLISGKTYYYKVKGNYSPDLSSDFSDVDSGYILQNYQFESTFGSLRYAYGIEFDNQDNIYVSDRTEGSINVYNSDYSFKKELINTNSLIRGLCWSLDSNLIVVNSNGGGVFEVDIKSGTKTDHFVSKSEILREVITDKQGNFYVSDVQNRDIIKLNSKWEFLKKWKMKQTTPSNNSSFYPSGLEYQDELIYISGVNSNRYIEVYDSDGVFLRQFNFPYSASYISQDAEGNFYYSCFTNRIVKTDKNGKLLALIGNGKLERCRSVNVNSKGVVFATEENQPSKIFTFKKAGK